jgi:acylphosphatase
MDIMSDNRLEAMVEQDRPVACRFVVTGRVQGVGYRDWMIKTARRVSLLGWVRNRLDGSVEAHVEGHPSRIDELAKACRRGPMLARVDGVDVTAASPEYPNGFHRRPTG